MNALQEKNTESELFFNITANETRGILLENSIPQEIYCELEEHRDMVGKIFKGKVTRILPNIKAAFIDIGIDKLAFLPFSRIKHNYNDRSNILENQYKNIIVGDEYLVQVVKNPVNKKGAKVTKTLSIPSRYFIYLINDNGIGVSSKIKNDKERKKLNDLASDFIIKNNLTHGLIVRTMAENVNEDILLADLESLLKLWESIEVKSQSKKAKNCVFEDLSLPARVIRDLPTRMVKNIWIDSEKDFQVLKQYIDDFLPDNESNVLFYDNDQPIFDRYNIEDCINSTLNRTISLPSGGSVIFDFTEAMTTIDINSGSFAGKDNKDEMAFHINTEAVTVIAQQLRLRNIGGIILIDLIDMENERFKRIVFDEFNRIMLADTLKYHIYPISQIGLIEMTREQNRHSLYQIMCEQCSACEGKGFAVSSGILFYQMIRRIKCIAAKSNSKKITVILGEKIYSYYNQYGVKQLNDLGKNINKKLNITQSSYDLDGEFDIVE